MSVTEMHMVERLRRATTPRECFACKTTIAAGVRYLACSGASNGRTWNNSYHPICRQVEVEQNLEAQAYARIMITEGSDDWYPLIEMVWDTEGQAIQDAPSNVRCRFSSYMLRFP